MSTQARLLLLVLTVVFLVGCGGPKANDMTAREAVMKVDQGMSTNQVREVLGAPETDKEIDNGKRIYAYSASDRKVLVVFENGEVKEARATDRIQFR